MRSGRSASLGRVEEGATRAAGVKLVRVGDVRREKALVLRPKGPVDVGSGGEESLFAALLTAVTAASVSAGSASIADARLKGRLKAREIGSAKGRLSRRILRAVMGVKEVGNVGARRTCGVACLGWLD